MLLSAFYFGWSFDQRYRSDDSYAIIFNPTWFCLAKLNQIHSMLYCWMSYLTINKTEHSPNQTSVFHFKFIPIIFFLFAAGEYKH